MDKYQELVSTNQALKEQLADQPNALQVEQVLSLVKQVREAGMYIGDPQQRSQLREILTSWGPFVYERKGEFPAMQLAPYEPTNKGSRLPIPRSVLFGVLVIALVAVVIYVAVSIIIPNQQNTAHLSSTATALAMIIQSQTPAPTSGCPDSSKYGFESADVTWKPQTWEDSQAVTAVSQSEKNTARFGCYSLKLIVDLVAGDPNKSKGETYVDMLVSPPAEETVPVNLDGKEITVWMYMQEGAAGSPSEPNGVQVFVRDSNFRSEYGPWLNLVGNTERWIPVKLTPSKLDNGFDPTNIIVVGVKIGAGGGSKTTYRGTIYVDGVNW